jgi:hypothetical protein
VAEAQPLPRIIATDVGSHTPPGKPPRRPPQTGGRHGQAIPTHHPAVVLRSHYRLRALLAIAMVAVVGLTCAVVILAGHDD